MPDSFEIEGNTVPIAKGYKVKKTNKWVRQGASSTFNASYGFGGREHLKTTLASLGDH